MITSDDKGVAEWVFFNSGADRVSASRPPKILRHKRVHGLLRVTRNLVRFKRWFQHVFLQSLCMKRICIGESTGILVNVSTFDRIISKFECCMNELIGGQKQRVAVVSLIPTAHISSYHAERCESSDDRR